MLCLVDSLVVAELERQEQLAFAIRRKRAISTLLKVLALNSRSFSIFLLIFSSVAPSGNEQQHCNSDLVAGCSVVVYESPTVSIALLSYLIQLLTSPL